MSYSPPRILLRQHDHPGLSPQQALILAESAMKDGRTYDAERLIEIVYDRFDAIANHHATQH